MYYSLLFPEAEIRVCPGSASLNIDTWTETEEGIDTVLGEVERCGTQFHDILKESPAQRLSFPSPLERRFLPSRDPETGHLRPGLHSP